MAYENSLSFLKNKESFGRQEIVQFLAKQYQGMSDSFYRLKMQKLLDEGKVARVGRNRYCIPGKETHYFYDYSKLARRIQKIVSEKHPFLEYRIFELVQLNEFLNHQIAHNTVFISVESGLGDFVFETLKEEFAGKILLNPTIKEYHLYWQDDMIVVGKLPTESPKGKKEPWQTCLEKMLVDLMADKLLKTTFSEAEYPEILEQAFQRYIIDESQMFRYAKRRHVKGKILEMIQNQTTIKLRMEN